MGRLRGKSQLIPEGKPQWLRSMAWTWWHLHRKITVPQSSLLLWGSRCALPWKWLLFSSSCWALLHRWRKSKHRNSSQIFFICYQQKPKESKSSLGSLQISLDSTWQSWRNRQIIDGGTNFFYFRKQRKQFKSCTVKRTHPWRFI